MTILQLRHFVAVAENHNYSLAAEKLYTSQSTVSKQILNLEKELNTQLFDRTHRKVTLTESGQIVYNYAKEILKNYNGILTDLSTYSDDPKGALVLGAIPGFSHYNLLNLLSAFSESYPNIEVQFHEMEARDLLDAIREGEVDLAFFRKEFMDDSMEMIPMACDRLIAVLPKTHPLAKESSLTLTKLAKEPFLFPDESTLHLPSLCDLCERNGFSPNIFYTSAHVENILSLVEKGVGVSLLMETIVRDLNQYDVSLVPLRDPSDSMKSTLGLVRLKSKAIRPINLAFWECARSQHSPISTS